MKEGLFKKDGSRQGESVDVRYYDLQRSQAGGEKRGGGILAKGCADFKTVRLVAKR